MEDMAVSIDINVTKIVKYVCFSGVAIVAVIFGEKAYAAYICAKTKEEQ